MENYPKRPMRIQVCCRTAEAREWYEHSRLPGQDLRHQGAIARGIEPAPLEDLLFHGGRTVPQMSFQNIFLGSPSDWVEADVDAINDAIRRAMRNRRLENVIRQYFPGRQIGCEMLAAVFANGPRPDRVTEDDIRKRVAALLTAGTLAADNLDSRIFNLLLPADAVLELPGLSSTDGLGGFHGSMKVDHEGESRTVYYSANVFSSMVEGRENGIVAFDAPWKNVVATLYHELNEFRTDPDVQDAIDQNDNNFLGWMSRSGQEVGDQPILQAGDHLQRVFQEVADGTSQRVILLPVQFMYSNVVHGAEGPIARAHAAAGAAATSLADAPARPHASAHGGRVRGLDAGALPGVPFGRFGNMLPRIPARNIPVSALKDLAQAMVKIDAGAPIVERELVDENPCLPAGYTYFGQFVDHDITFDPTPFATAERDPEALSDFRSPALDLDSVYGRGPDDQPYLYEPGTVRLRVGRVPGNGGAAVGTRHDLLRLSDGTPVLGDKRNDENKIVSQIHGAFIAFHNKVVDRDDLLLPYGLDLARPGTRFAAAARFVRWHYQWLVLHDYLARITMPGTVDAVLNPGGTPRLLHYLDAEARSPYMPIEFSGAAFRFGHSQVRPSYSLNRDALTARTPDKTLSDPTKSRIPTFARRRNDVPPEDRDAQDLNGFPGALPEPWGIDWAFFFDDLPRPPSNDPRLQGGTLQLPQPSYRIDAILVDRLADLPEFFKDTDQGAPGSLVGHLAFRNLLRGQNLGLPSGQQAAHDLGEPVLGDDVLWDAGSRLLDEKALSPELLADLKDTRERRAQVRTRWVDGGGRPLAGNAPLWYYVLREAEYQGVEGRRNDPAIGFGGQHLGSVGSRIVAETLIGLLWRDKDSILHAQRGFSPHPEVVGDPGPFTLSRLMRFALG